MDFSEVDLANAISHSLEYKRLTGQENLLGESMLTLVAAEYLAAKGWSSQGEVDSRSLDGSLGYFGSDLVATSNYDEERKLIFEFKFLKAGRIDFKRVTDDIIKLSYLPQVSRFCFLIVGYLGNINNFDRFKHLSQVHFSLENNDNDLGSVAPSQDLKRRIIYEFGGKLPPPRSVALSFFSQGEMRLVVLRIAPLLPDQSA